MVGTFKGLGVLLSQLVHIGEGHFDEEAADDHATAAVARGTFMRGDGIDGAATVDFTGDDGIIPSAVVDIDSTGHDSLGDVGTTEDDAPLIVYLNDIAVLDASFFSSRRVQPDGFVEVAVRSPDLAGYYFVEPVNIIELGVDAPPGVVGYNQQRVFLSPVEQQAFLVGLAVGYLVGYRRPLFVIGEVLGQSPGIEL